jgi:hypothetical protein
MEKISQSIARVIRNAKYRPQRYVCHVCEPWKDHADTEVCYSVESSYALDLLREQLCV